MSEILGAAAGGGMRCLDLSTVDISYPGRPGITESPSTVGLTPPHEELLQKLSADGKLSKSRILAAAITARISQWKAEGGEAVRAADYKSGGVGDSRKQMQAYEKSRREAPTLWEGVLVSLAGTGMQIISVEHSAENKKFSPEAGAWVKLLTSAAAPGAAARLPPGFSVKFSRSSRTWTETGFSGDSWSGSDEYDVTSTRRSAIFTAGDRSLLVAVIPTRETGNDPRESRNILVVASTSPVHAGEILEAATESLRTKPVKKSRAA